MTENNELAVSIEQLVATVQAQQRSIDALVELLERRERPPSTVPEPKPTDRPTDWSLLTGRERLLAWQGLATFVEDLVMRYDFQLQIRPCWWRHWYVVDELTALWHIRQTSFGDGADLRSAMAWQDSVLRVVERLFGAFASCRSGHVDTTMTTWMTDQVRQEFLQFVREDVLHSVPGGDRPSHPS